MIIGDANLSEVATYLKMGTTALVLAMIEDKFFSHDLSLEAPVADLRAVSHDPSLKYLVTLRDGRKMTAVQLQTEYLELARKYVEDRYGADADAMTLDVLDRWESVLTRLADDPMQLSRELDWVAKLELLEGYRRRDGLAWDAPKLQLFDLQYADVRQEKGLYNRLAARGRMDADDRRERDRLGDRQPAGGHQGVLPRPVPAAVRGLGGRRVLGLGDLRHPRPRVAAAGAHAGAAARHEGARRRACSTAARRRPTWSRR